MHREWNDMQLFGILELRFCDQARATRKNGLLSELELEDITRMVGYSAEYMRNESNMMEENGNCSREYIGVSREIRDIREHLSDENYWIINSISKQLKAEDNEFMCDFKKADQ